MTRFVGYAALMASAFSNSLVNGQASPPLATDNGVIANIFDMSQITLNEGRWHENQNRTLNYIKFVDPERMLYVFRQTHGLSTKSATPNGGWDAPDFPFRSHVQGHLLSAWAQCYSQLKDTQCRDKAVYFVKELAKCQANNAAVGFSAGYLSGFPESQFDRLNAGSDISGNVPYYAVHKTMQGLLDVWRHIGSTEARDVLLALAGWVDAETKPMSYTQMQRVLQTEFGGMNDILADIYRQTKDSRWIDVAKRFDHAAVFNPLAANTDNLNGLHANTQVPKWIGAAREYKATGNTTYLNIARNAFRMTTSAHTYAIGGNSQAEHFRPPNAIAGYLTTDTCEHCNTYNMLRLAKELWTIDPLPEYFDFYERALLNHLLGAQKHDDHGHITYFTPLKAGGKRGVGPAWGGGTWSTDHNSFWCCQGTGWEQNTKLNDAIYGHTGDALYVNLFAPSKVTWEEKKVTVQQVTNYPVDNKTTLKVQNAGTFKLNIRIPSWANNAEILINGKKENVAAAPGTYASISRTWAANDEVVVTLPMKARLVQANDNQSLAAIAYGPTILCGNYGSTAVSNTPTIDLSTLQKASSSALRFTAKVGGQTVNLEPFYDAQEFNYVVYWSYTGTLG